MFKRFFKSKKKEEEPPAPTTDALNLIDQHEREINKRAFDILMRSTSQFIGLEVRRTFFANKLDVLKRIAEADNQCT